MIFQPTQFSLGIVFMFLTVLIAGWTDWRRWRIPNGLLAGSAVIAIAWAGLSPSGIGWVRSLLGGATGLAVFLPFYLLRGMAAGDVKLLAVLGMYAGPMMVVDIALVSALVGGIWAVVLLVRRKAARRSQHLDVSEKADEAPYLADGRDYLKGRRVLPSGVARGYVIPYGVVMAISTLIVLGVSVFSVV